MRFKSIFSILRNYTFRDIARMIFLHPILSILGLLGKPISEFPKNAIYKYLPKNPLIIEAGCANGIDTVLFATDFPMGKIVALEPLPELFKIARTEFSAFSNINLHQLALSSESGTTKTLYAGAHNNFHQSSSLLKPSDHFNYYPEIDFTREIEVKTINISDLMKLSGFERVDLLWLDLQGHELTVLESTDPLILKTIRVLHIEISRKPLYEGAPSYVEVSNFMIKNGFKLVKKRMPLATGNAIYLNENADTFL